MQELAREVPVVERLRDVEALVALEPHQRRVERIGEPEGERGLADAGVALDEKRSTHPQREERRSGQAVVGEVPDLGEPGAELAR